MSVFLRAWDVLAQVKHIPNGAGLARGLSRAIEEADQGAALLLIRRAEELLKAYNPDQPRWPRGDPRAGQWRPSLGTGRGRVSPGHLTRDIAKLSGLIGDATRYGPRLSGHDLDRIGNEVEKVALRYSTRKTYEKRLADLHAERTRIHDAKWAAFEKAWRAATPEKAMEMDAAQFLSAKDTKHLKALADEQSRLVRERDRADRDAMLGVLSKTRPMGGRLNHVPATGNTVDQSSGIKHQYAQERPGTEPVRAMNSDLNASLNAILKVIPKAWLDDTNAKGDVSFEFSTERAFASTKRVGERQNTTIRVDPRAKNQNTLLHELSHRLEIVYGDEGMSGYNPIAQATHGFLYERAGGETPQKLQDLYPGYAYEDHELARPDKFVDAYIGKMYGGQVTEVLTMGMEMLWFPRYGGRDINKDPGMRRLILGLLAAA